MENTRLKLMLDYPFFGNMALSIKLIPDKSIRTLETNGKCIKYNPDYINKGSKGEKLFWYMHELGHVFLLHPFRLGDRNPGIANIAMDHAVNLMLRDAHVGEVPQGAIMDEKYSGWSFERIYEDLVSEFSDTNNQESMEQEGSEDSEDSSVNSEDSEDSDSESSEDSSEDSEDKDQEDSEDSSEDSEDKDQEDSEDSDNQNKSDPDSPGDSEPEESKQEDSCTSETKSPKQQELEDLIERTKQFGTVEKAPDDLPEHEVEENINMSDKIDKLSGGKGLDRDSAMGRILEEMTSTEVSWKEELAQFVNQSCTASYNWMRPNMRYAQATNGILLPTLNSMESLTLAVAFDVSYSIDNRQASLFLAEFKSLISSIEYEEVFIVCCAKEIFNPKTYKKHENIDYVIQGTGGTASAPVWREIKQQQIKPACLVYFTDLEVFDWGEDPGYPILWVVHSRDNVSQERLDREAPFGKVVRMKKQLLER